MREMTDRRGTRRHTGGMRACLWLAITLMACIACSDENIGSLFEGADTETSTDRGTIFRVGAMTRLAHDSIYTYFEDGEEVGCLLTSGDTLVANTQWTYSADNGWIAIDTLWQYTYDADGTLTATDKVGATDYDALLDTDEDGYTYTRQPGRELKLYFYYPFTDSIGPDNYKACAFNIASDQVNYKEEMCAGLLSTDTCYTIGQGSATLLFKWRYAILRVTSNVSLTSIWLIPGEEGTRLSGQMDLTTGDIDFGEDACTDTLKPYDNSSDSTEYLFILPPQTITDATLKMIVSYQSSLYEGDSTSTYKKVFDSIELQGGDLYSYNFADGIDLGGSVIWAAYNVGATNIWDSGDYYARAETETKDTFTASTYDSTFLKAIIQEGNSTNNNMRGTKYDAAHVKWGGSWRIPTVSECQEMLDGCSKTEVILCDEYNDTIKVGFWYKSTTTGDSVFFPCTGLKRGDSLWHEKEMIIFPVDSIGKNEGGIYIGEFFASFSYEYQVRDYDIGVDTIDYKGIDGAPWHDSIWIGAPIRPVRDK